MSLRENLAAGAAGAGVVRSLQSPSPRRSKTKSGPCSAGGVKKLAHQPTFGSGGAPDAHAARHAVAFRDPELAGGVERKGTNRFHFFRLPRAERWASARFSGRRRRRPQPRWPRTSRDRSAWCPRRRRWELHDRRQNRRQSRAVSARSLRGRPRARRSRRAVNRWRPKRPRDRPRRAVRR